jgi:glycosyltransferase involved in cell wall biosynthesis
MSLAGVRLLCVLPQLPHDCASGAARSTRTICEMLSAAGCTVRTLGTTASEQGGPSNALTALRELGIQPQVEPGRTAQRIRPEIAFSDRGIGYLLLDTGGRSMLGWQELYGKQFDRMFDDQIHGFRPHLLFGYGGLPGDIRRYQRARRQGVRLVFALRNAHYQGRGLLEHMDGILTPSRFLTDLYRESVGVESTPLPTPIDPEDVVAEDRDPIFFTMINPSPEKGMMFVARLAEELSVRRPDIPMLIVESRGSAGHLLQAGLRGGFDLSRHPNLMMSPPLNPPREIYVPTRALLVPSVGPEAFARVAAEAFMNGIPPLVSDRGGLPEACEEAGFVLPFAEDMTPGMREPVASEVVQPWLELMIRLAGDASFYEQECGKALEAGKRFAPATVAPRYVQFFDSIVNGK